MFLKPTNDVKRIAEGHARLVRAAFGYLCMVFLVWRIYRECLPHGSGLSFEVPLDQSIHQRLQGLAGFGQHKGLGLLVPVELEAGR